MTSDQINLLLKSVQDLSLARDIDSIMLIVRKTARELTRADGATFVLKDNGFCYYADEDAIGPLWKGQRFPLDSCISGWSMINRRPAVVPDIYKDPRIPIEAYKPTFVKSLVMVPIRTMDPVGAIGNYWAETHNPTDEEVQLLQSLADMTSVSIENVYMYNDLEERVRQRTEELQNANKELESFSYSVSHDLRAPLRSIIGFSKILEEEAAQALDEEGKRLLGTVITNAERMNLLIDDLLQFSKTGIRELEKNQVNMKDLALSILKETVQNGNGKKIVYEVRDLPSCYADPKLMKQVWVNLISNAIKYSSQKELSEIEIGFSENEGKRFYFIRDNGVGFDMKYYDKLFGVFQRLHSTQQFEGTGVGLALVKRILDRHGGAIWAESVPGEGATFFFTLPENGEEK